MLFEAVVPKPSDSGLHMRTFCNSPASTGFQGSRSCKNGSAGEIRLVIALCEDRRNSPL